MHPPPLTFVSTIWPLHLLPQIWVIHPCSLSSLLFIFQRHLWWQGLDFIFIMALWQMLLTHFTSSWDHILTSNIPCLILTRANSKVASFPLSMEWLVNLGTCCVIGVICICWSIELCRPYEMNWPHWLILDLPDGVFLKSSYLIRSFTVMQSISP